MQHQVLSDTSLEPWLAAARGFIMSADLVVEDAEGADSRDITGFKECDEGVQR